MKTHYPVAGLFLILSFGCSDCSEQVKIEPKQNEEVQLGLQAMHETFVAASNCLRPVPMPPLMVTDILGNPCPDAEYCNRIVTLNDNVEITAAGIRTNGDLEPSAGN